MQDRHRHRTDHQGQEKDRPPDPSYCYVTGSQHRKHSILQEYGQIPQGIVFQQVIEHCKGQPEKAEHQSRPACTEEYNQPYRACDGKSCCREPSHFFLAEKPAGEDLDRLLAGLVHPAHEIMPVTGKVATYLEKDHRHKGQHCIQPIHVETVGSSDPAHEHGARHYRHGTGRE